MRETVTAAIIEEKKILLVQKGESWLLPGGKPKKSESDIECLSREIREELSGTKIKNIHSYQNFVGETHIGEPFKTKVYFAEIDGMLGEPSAEIKACKWVDDAGNYSFSDVNAKVMAALVNDGHLEER